jgi:hypothetical protein
MCNWNFFVIGSHGNRPQQLLFAVFWIVVLIMVVMIFSNKN